MSDYITASARRQHVIDQLGMHGGPKKSISISTLICCPFHSEVTPSCRVFHGATTRSPGSFKCYGCKAKGGWGDLATALGLQPFAPREPREEFVNPNLLNIEPDAKPEEPLIMDTMEMRELPRNKLWRSIKTNMLIKLGAKICVVDSPKINERTGQRIGKLKPKVWLPVYINKELKGYIKARYKKHAEYPSYVNASGPWSKTHGLFPFDYAIEIMRGTGTKTVVLVEGPRDALWLLQQGIPAICILGTQSWTDVKARILEVAGVTHVLLLMDGDCAGKAASAMIAAALKSYIKVTELKLWNMKGSPWRKFRHLDEPSKEAKKAGVALWDAAACPQYVLDDIKETYFT